MNILAGFTNIGSCWTTRVLAGLQLVLHHTLLPLQCSLLLLKLIPVVVSDTKMDQYLNIVVEKMRPLKQNIN